MRSVIYRLGWTFGALGAISIILALAFLPKRTIRAARVESSDVSAAVIETPVSVPASTASNDSPKRHSLMDQMRTIPSDSRPQRDRSYDSRPFERMAEDWNREKDDPDWSLNATTFIEAMLETMNPGSDPGTLDELSVRCRASVCRIDARGELSTLSKLRDLSREQQDHVTYQTLDGDGGIVVEAYLARERAEPTDAQ